jgi:2-alkenal reductase
LVRRSQPVLIEPVSHTEPLDLAPISAVDISPEIPRPPTHIITEEYSPVEAVNMVLPAVVTVLVRDQDSGGNGSGFFISPEGYVVTNNHVVEDVEDIAIIYAQGGIAPAELVGTAPEFDLAVLKVDGPVPAVAKWGDSGELPLGTSVIAIGSALGRYQNTVTAGVLSGFNRELGTLRALLQTDAAINQGNSGGPLINLGGQVIGINTLVLRGGFSRAEGLNFAISSNVARQVIQQLMENGEVDPPFLGIQYEELHEGILLQDVLVDTPANQAGLQAGDVIATINGQPVDDRHPLISLLLEHRAGETITLEVLRDGETFQTTLTLGKRA